MSLKQELGEAIAREARLAILKELSEQVDGRLASGLLQRVLDSYGFRRDRDWVETQMRKLESLGAVSLSEVGPILIARIERAGRDHLEERGVLSGIARPSEIG